MGLDIYELTNIKPHLYVLVHNLMHLGVILFRGFFMC